MSPPVLFKTLRLNNTSFLDVEKKKINGNHLISWQIARAIRRMEYQPGIGPQKKKRTMKEAVPLPASQRGPGSTAIPMDKKKKQGKGSISYIHRK